MKYESFIAINSVYLVSFFPISLIAFCIVKIRFKKALLTKYDLCFLMGGLIYWFFYEFTPVIKGKTLSNIIVELSSAGLLCCIVFVLRIILGAKQPNSNKGYAFISVLIILLIIILTGLFIPSIAE